MKKLFLFLVLFSNLIFSQTKEDVERDFDAPDSLYREDQFYFNISYSSLQNQPNGFRQNKFSPSLSLGFLRDMPLNKARTFAIAAGLGYTISAYNHNLVIDPNNGSLDYSLIGNDVIYSKDKLSIHTIDLPIEIRWRNSTPESHKFWRIYGGFKFSYKVFDRYKFVADTGTIKLSNIEDINKFLFGTYLSVGWNTVNFYAYYGLNPLFKSSAKIDGKTVDLNALHFGLMFYIL